jgi:hypothetical protein
MSRALHPRSIPVGLLVVDNAPPQSRGIPHDRPSPQAKALSNTAATGRTSWLRAGLAGTVVGLFHAACLGLMAVALRPVPQTAIETAYCPPPETSDASAEVSPGPVAESGSVASRIELGEARPTAYATEPPAPAEVAPPETTKTPIAQKPPRDRFGTKINFARSQSVAFDRALREQKLVMLLHLAGNFEDSGFT